MVSVKQCKYCGAEIKREDCFSNYHFDQKLYCNKKCRSLSRFSEEVRNNRYKP